MIWNKVVPRRACKSGWGDRLSIKEAKPMTTRHWLMGAGLAVALWSGPAFAQGDGYREWMWGYGPGGWGGMMLGGGLAMVIFWGGIILLVVLLARWFGGAGSAHQSANPPRQTALEILQERYARGEIDKTEYEERRKTLTG
jgi:putative membrane protein